MDLQLFECWENARNQYKIQNCSSELSILGLKYTLLCNGVRKIKSLDFEDIFH